MEDITHAFRYFWIYFFTTIYNKLSRRLQNHHLETEWHGLAIWLAYSTSKPTTHKSLAYDWWYDGNISDVMSSVCNVIPHPKSSNNQCEILFHLFLPPFFPVFFLFGRWTFSNFFSIFSLWRCFFDDAFWTWHDKQNFLVYFSFTFLFHVSWFKLLCKI